MEDRFLQEAAEMLKVMGHPLRIKIVQCLEAGELNVGDIAQAVGLTQSVTSQHLKTMRVRGLLSARRESSRVFYSISRPEIYKIIDCIREGRQRESAFEKAVE